jgi:hypothetical protein
VILTVVSLAVSVAAAVVVFRVARTQLGSAPVALVPALAVAAALFWLPGVAHDTLARIRIYHRLGRSQADLAAATQYSLHPRAFVRVKATVPRDAKLYIRGNGAFRFWAYTYLLPRVAVDDPAKADWVLAPKRIDLPGVTYSRQFTFDPIFLGEVRH